MNSYTQKNDLKSSFIENDAVGNVNFEEVTRELVRHLRGKEHQTRLSQKLGYSFNQVGKWEVGEKKMLWPEFLKILHVKKRPLAIGLKAAFFLNFNTDNSNVLLRELQGGLSISEFAKRLGVPRLRLNRWLLGTSELPLSDFLRALHIVRNNVIDFISPLVNSESLPSLAKILDRQRSEASLHLDNPWVAAVIRSLEVAPSKDSVKFLSRSFGITEEEARSILQKLTDLNLVRKSKNGAFLVTNKRLNLPVGAESAKTKDFWLAFALEAFRKLPVNEKNGPKANIFGYNVFSMSEEGHERLVQLYAVFYSNLREILTEEEEKKIQPTRVSLLNVQLLDLTSCGRHVGIIKK